MSKSESIKEYNREWQRAKRAAMTEEERKVNNQRDYSYRVKRLLRSPEVYHKYYTNRFNKQLEVKYGLSREQYDELLKFQDNKCAICKKEFDTAKRRAKSPVVDHNHVTRKVRAILCRNCNAAIGLLEDNFEICQLASLYLQKHTEI